ncbi:LysR family transcriptional regulator [Sedimentitalea arenosa]|uniref:LysR family transcriptional regulator n=1 Tax=Sedimentitalea arenosa TaxID=2798803 RepID=A0A8J7IQN6_9RHOB|nr:LysR family transcriptional regulator [Arenibacterium arenosum]MBJ6371881.1 LysR family transcriptional regulator [Arenibacterium arenosum]
MTEIRDLKLLVSLARNRHFSRAAEDCGISQPAFSARIRKMEDALAIPLVRRGNKFLGFTREGEVVLKWARRLLNDTEGMRQEIDALRQTLKGKLVVGTVPTALPFAAHVSSRLRKTHPGLSLELQSLSSRQIDIRLNDYSLDAGITYFSEADPDCTESLYKEKYVLLAPEHLAPRSSGQARWSEAAKLPLCLLTPDMRNRQFVDETFRSIGASPTIVMEANGFTAVLVQVSSGNAATIAPKSVAETYFARQNSVELDLVEPFVTQTIGLAIKEQTPEPPIITAFRHAVHQSL